MSSWFYISLVFLSSFLTSWASEAGIKPFRLGAILGQGEGAYKPMACGSLERKIQSVLKKYYNDTFGGDENWEKLESLILKGQLTLRNGKVFELTINRKKPDFSKSIITLDGGHKIITSFDGEDTWQHITYETDKPVDMNNKASLNYTRDAVFGSHLLYPELPGKTITYLNEARLDGRLCYRLKVTLPNGQSLIIAIDIETGMQIACEYVCAVNNREARLMQSDFRKVAGVSIPCRIEVYWGDELQEVITLKSIQANRGLTGWMFQRR